MQKRLAPQRPESRPAERQIGTSSPERTLGPALESLVLALIVEHERLLEAVEHHRLALLRADTALIAGAVQEQTQILERLSVLERERAALAKDPHGHPATITSLAEAIPDPGRTRLLEMTERLRTLIHQLRDRQAVVRAASHALLTHTQGLMSQVGAALSHAGTYGRAGRIESTTPACAVLDMAS